MKKVLCAIALVMMLSLTMLSLRLAQADSVGPAVSFYSPTNGQTITSLSNANNEGGGVTNAIVDNDGISRVNLYIKRVQDSYYWNNNGTWVSYPYAISLEASPVNPPNYATVYITGPKRSNLSPGQAYLLKCEAVDGLGNRGSATITLYAASNL